MPPSGQFVDGMSGVSDSFTGMRGFLVLGTVSAGLWAVALRSTDGTVPTIACVGALIASVLIGVAGPPRPAIVVGTLVGLAVLLVPLHGGPPQREGSCDPFCSEEGASLLVAFGPFALLALLLLISPTIVGAALRHCRHTRRRQRALS